MKMKILNLFIALAVLLNVMWGWHMGRLDAECKRQSAAGCLTKPLEGSADLTKNPNNGSCVSPSDPDRRIGLVVDQLQKMGLAEDTVLVIRADGDSFTESIPPVVSANLR